MTLEQACLVIVLAPLAASLLAGLGARFIGRAGAHSVTIAGVATAFGLSVWVLRQLLAPGAEPLDHTLYTWGVSDGISMEKVNNEM